MTDGAKKIIRTFDDLIVFFDAVDSENDDRNDKFKTEFGDDRAF